jgi:hypothetical protein
METYPLNCYTVPALRTILTVFWPQDSAARNIGFLDFLNPCKGYVRRRHPAHPTGITVLRFDGIRCRCVDQRCGRTAALRPNCGLVQLYLEYNYALMTRSYLEYYLM